MHNTVLCTARMNTMKEAHIHADTSVSLHDVPIPQIMHPHQLLVRVYAVSCNPKDWKLATGTLMTISSCPNSGDDIAGIVIAVGPAVLSFRPGDRVAALHELGTPHGAFAEYAIVYEWTTFHIGERTSFEEAATVPMAAYVGAVGLCAMLGVVAGPWQASAAVKEPLLVYGAASAVGSAVVRLAGIMGVHPIICVAGNGIPFVEGLIDQSKGDVVIDYRSGPDKVSEDIQKFLGTAKLRYVFDAISEKDSHENYWRSIDQERGRVTWVLGGHRAEIPEGIEQTTTMAGSLWKELTPLGEKDRLGMGIGGKDFGFAYSSLIGQWLEDKRWKLHPFEVVEHGLCGLETALKRLRYGKSSATKYVIRIADTSQLERGPNSDA